MTSRQKIIDALSAFFAHKHEVPLALLYGSFARGTQNVASDVDIAIHTVNPLDAAQLVGLHAELSALLHRDVDLLELRQAEGVILTQVIKEGIRVKYDSSTFARYNLKAIYFHEDFLPALRRMQDAHIRSFVNGS